MRVMIGPKISFITTCTHKICSCAACDLALPVSYPFHITYLSLGAELDHSPGSFELFLMKNYIIYKVIFYV